MSQSLCILLSVFLLAAIGCRKSVPGDWNPRGSQEALRILPLGNSITAGSKHSYRYSLWYMLKDEGLDFNFVGNLNDNPMKYKGRWDKDHEGHPGWTTSQLETQLSIWLDNYTPDVVLLHTGTNDIIGIGRGTGSLSHSEKALRSIISKLRNSNPAVRILLARILPIYSDGGVLLPKVEDWNKRIDVLAEELDQPDSPIQVVDMHSDFTSDDLEDGVHPTAEGAEKMALRWKKALLP
jgi:hypothetical protein